MWRNDLKIRMPEPADALRGLGIAVHTVPMRRTLPDEMRGLLRSIITNRPFLMTRDHRAEMARRKPLVRFWPEPWMSSEWKNSVSPGFISVCTRLAAAPAPLTPRKPKFT